MNCELGMVAVQVVNIENPLNTELRLDCLSNNPTVFTIQPKGTLQIEAHQGEVLMMSRGSEAGGGSGSGIGKSSVSAAAALQSGVKFQTMRIEPNGWGKAIVRYMPSQIDQMESALLKLVSKDAGIWEFTVKGKGRNPTLLPTVEIFAQIGESQSRSISFSNPFAHPLFCSIQVESDNINSDMLQPQLNQQQNANTSGGGNEPNQFNQQKTDKEVESGGRSGQSTDNNKDTQAPCFTITLKSLQNIFLDSRAQFQVPIVFTPTRVLTVTARVIQKVHTDPVHHPSQTAYFTEQNTLIWTQPIVGIAEMFFFQVLKMAKSYRLEGDGIGREGQGDTEGIVVVGGDGNGGANGNEGRLIVDIGTKEQATLSVTTQTGIAVEKLLQFPLVGLTMTKKSIYQFVVNCANAGLARLSSVFSRQQTQPANQNIMYGHFQRYQQQRNSSQQGTPNRNADTDSVASQNREQDNQDQKKTEEEVSAFNYALRSVVTIDVQYEDKQQKSILRYLLYIIYKTLSQIKK
ncbi:MAG: hypothetical protein EZS28_009695 [Streblomastix strix]|uniref:Uncharacterized protein n=1 Tax=Streblomastix strix TaxID=222440 RepID=A0A5J4WKG1_9EUKA|nr:MAG: hypothetical protein EZS28_009695 [Streblomastix strix]